MNWRTYLLISVASFAVVLVGISALARMGHSIGRVASTNPNIPATDESSWPRLPTGTVSIGNTVVIAEIADSPAEQIRGLSLHPPLLENEGMFFMFAGEAPQAFWMKDMLFALDMIWLDSDLIVVDVTENATPGSYPTTFSPKAEAQYVLEVNAGFADTHGIEAGTKASVTLPDGSVLP